MNIFLLIGIFVLISGLGTVSFFQYKESKSLKKRVEELEWKMNEAFGFTQDNIPD